MAKKMEGLEQLLVDELRDLFDAEKQLVRALPKMAKSASDQELEMAFREHLEVTRGQVQRLEQVFESMDMRARSKPCHGMKGLVEEGQEMMQEDHEESVLDSGLIGAARKVEHYEMAGYETARALAQQLGMRDVAQLLQETLREETETDRKLASISKRLLKQGSAQRKPMPRASGRGTAGGAAHPLTDHDEIRQWAEERGGTPACVRGTGNRGDIGVLRLDFPGYSGEETLQPISWDDWFEKFDERKLALIVQDRTGGGQKSNFNKLIGRPKTKSRR